MRLGTFPRAVNTSGWALLFQEPHSLRPGEEEVKEVENREFGSLFFTWCLPSPCTWAWNSVKWAVVFPKELG